VPAPPSPTATATPPEAPALPTDTAAPLLSYFSPCSGRPGMGDAAGAKRG
jgi:hypothetical protein